MPKALTAAQVAHYHEQGYCFPHRLLDDGEVAGLRGQIEAYEAAHDGAIAGGRRNKSHLLFKWLDDLIRNDDLLDAIEDLIGPDILCWNTLFWIKEAGSKSFVSWHQDSRYWGLTEDTLVTAWVALSEASVEAGCMKVLPGSHREKLREHEDRYDDANMLTRGQEISEEIDESRAVHMPLKAGEVSLHNIRTAHASGPNTSPDRRIGVSLHFIPPSVAQVVGDWDCAALVRGQDTHGHFEHTPRVPADLDPEIVAYHARASAAISDVLYKGAAHQTAKL